MNKDLKKLLIKNFFKYPKNIVFYLKNYIFKNNDTPKEIRMFSCFMCKGTFIFPITSMDYMSCNECWETLGSD